MNKAITWLTLYTFTFTPAVLLLSSPAARANDSPSTLGTSSAPMPGQADSGSPHAPPTTSIPPLRGLESQPPTPVLKERVETAATAKTASVESYFTLGPDRDIGPSRGAQMQPRTVVYSAPSEDQKHKDHGFVWHLLDNLGVPMFGKVEAEIDPSIKSVYVIPPPKLPSERVLLKGSGFASITENKAPGQADNQSAQPAQQKIPDSELEGTIYETPASKDTQTKAQ